MDFGKIGDFFTGGGEYADPTKIDPVYGVPRGMVRDAQWNTIGNISSTLLAAGMRMTPAQRAQILMQGLGNAGSRQTQELYQGQQMRARADEMQQQAAERAQRAQALETIRANPSAYGLTAEQAKLLGPSSVAKVIENQLAADSYHYATDGSGRLIAINKNDPSKVHYIGNASGPEWEPTTIQGPNGPVQGQRNRRTGETKGLGLGGGVNVNVGGGSDKQMFDAVKESADAARAAATGLTAIQEARGAIEGGAILGAGADARLGFAKLGQVLGLGDPEKIVNTETFRSAIAPQVAATMKATVGSTQISNADREFAEKAAGGSITLDPKSITRLLGIMEKANRVIIEQHQSRLDTIYDDKDKFKKERALFSVAAPERARVDGQGATPNVAPSRADIEAEMRRRGLR